MAGCIPCFIIPLLLFIFHRYIQPILLRYWKPWGKKVEEKLKMLCKDGTCFKNKQQPDKEVSSECVKKED